MTNARMMTAVSVQSCVDPVAADFFEKQREDPANCICFEKSGAKALWASISHGIYLGIEAAGAHRSLGVKVSFVQSITLDAWKPVHLRMMELGGNARFDDFLNKHGIDQCMQIQEKYMTRAAEWYRENLRAMAEGSTPPEPLAPGTGHLPLMSNNPGASDVQRRAGTEVQQGIMTDSETDLEEQRHRGSLCRRASQCIKAAWDAVSGTDSPISSRSPTSGDRLIGPTYGSQQSAYVPKIAAQLVVSDAATAIQKTASNGAAAAAAAA